jgi:hypothetical protein
VPRPESIDDWTLADWEEWNAELDVKLNRDPEWVRRYGRQAFEAALTQFGYGPLLKKGK